MAKSSWHEFSPGFRVGGSVERGKLPVGKKGIGIRLERISYLNNEKFFSYERMVLISNLH